MSVQHVIEKLLADPEFTEGVYWRRQSVPANAEIIKQGEESHNLYQVAKGTARVIGRVEVGEMRQVSPGVCDLGEGEIFGELVLFDNEPRSASVTAVTDCEFIVLDGDKLLEYLENNTDLGYDFMKTLMETMVQRLRRTNKKIFSLLAWGLKAHQIDDHLK